MCLNSPPPPHTHQRRMWQAPYFLTARPRASHIRPCLSSQNSLGESHVLLSSWPVRGNAAWNLYCPSPTTEAVELWELSWFSSSIDQNSSLPKPGILALARRWQSGYMKCNSNSSTKFLRVFQDFEGSLNWASATNGFYAGKGLLTSSFSAWTGILAMISPYTAQLLTV